MAHPDPDELALLALEEDVDPTAVHHLRTCEQCQTEIAQLRRVVRGAQRGDTPVELTMPPAHVWDRIAAEAIPTTEPATGSPSMGFAPAASDRARPTKRRVPTWLAAAAGLLIGATGSAIVASVLDTESGTPPPSATVASANLRPLSEQGTRARATIVEDDGVRVLTLRLPAAAERTGNDFREVWLLNTEQGSLVSLGVLAGDSGSFALPGDLDLGDYTTVDISAEPYDGDPAHSGDSLARGRLVF